MWFLALKAAFGLLLLGLATFGAGAWLWKFLPKDFNRLDRISCGLLGGIGLLSLVLFLVGQFAFNRTTILLVMCPAIIAGLGQLWRHRRWLPHYSYFIDAIPKVPATIVFIILLATAVTGLSEVTGDWGNDAIAYHLLGPKVWLRQGIIRPVLDNSHTAFPPTAETIYAALLCIGGTRAPRFSSLLTLGMLLLAAGSLAMRCGLTGRQSWWVAALIATMPAIYFGSVNCFVDGIYAAFVLAAMRIGFDAEKTGHWAIFGIFCGLAMGTKYTGLLALPVLILTAAIIGISRKNLAWRLVVRDAFLAAAIACVVAAPYYARNWILLGCPIYPPPPGYEIFCSPKYLSAETIKQFHAYIAQRGAGLGRNFLAFVLLPYNLTYHTSNFHGAGGIGLCPLALGPLGMFVSRKDKFVKGIAIAAFLVVVAWFLTQQESRFLIHVYVIAAILSVIGWRDVLSTRNPSSRIIAGGIVATSLLYGMFMMDGNLSASVRAVVSAAFAQQERSTNIPYYQSFRYLNTTEDVKKVLILDRSVPPFYCDKEYLKPIGQWGEVTITGISTAVQAIDQVHALNITHILDVSSQAAPFQVAVNDPRLLRVFEDTNQRIYRVK